MLLEKEQIVQKHLYLVQVLELSKYEKLENKQQCEDLSMEIEKLRIEVSKYLILTIIYISY